MRFCGNCGSRLQEGESTRLRDAAFQPIDPAQLGPEARSAGAVEDSLRDGRTLATPEQLGVLTGADLLERFRRAGLEARGQRRSVTVLFVDLSGFTQLSQELSDEDLYELVQKFIRVLVNDVYKYEGMVDKLTGDGLMALFGAPIAHENNAERALRAALDMQADVAELSKELSAPLRLPEGALRIHVGLNAGSVIVGGLGGDGIMNYTAIGDSVNLARRLEEAAEPGCVVVSESVYRQTQRLFDFENMPPMRLKNITRPVRAYLAIGPKDRPGSVRGLEGLRAPMIGREQEFRLAYEMVERLVEARQGGLALVVGEGGMGKSRLAREVKARLESTRLHILEGQSLTYRKSIAYWIFQDVIRGCLGVPASAPAGEVRESLQRCVVEALGDAGVEKIPYLESLLGLEPSDPAAAARIRYLTASQLRQQIFLAVRDVLMAESRSRPVLLILEDLHWADDASLDLVRFLIDSTRNAALLIFAISRPFEGGSIQAIHEHATQRLAERYLYLRLKALPPERSAQLLQALLSIQDIPEELRAQIIQRSAGLPFYLEEILRMLIENNVISRQERGDGQLQWQLTPGAEANAIGVPETLQGLILTRFDRLPPQHRRALQTASVIGYQFRKPVLARVLEESQSPSAVDEVFGGAAAVQESLNYLVEHDFILPEADGDENYLFRHVLVSDAVYSTLLQRDRRALHTLTGQAIEAFSAADLDGQIEVLAGHFLRSPLLDRALHYLTLAGQKAARSFANEQARQHFTQALEVLAKVAHTRDQAVQVYLGLGDALFTAGDYPAARSYFSRALELFGARVGTGSLSAEETDPAEWAARKSQVSMLQRKIAQTHEGQGEYERALACLRAAEALLDGRESRFSGERASILGDTGWIHYRRGSMDQAESVLREALALAESAGQPDVLASVLNRLAGIYFQRDDSTQAARFLARSLVLRQQIGDVVGVARSFNNLGLLGWKQGDLVSALDNFDHSFKLLANLGDVEGLIVLHTNMGMIELDLGNLPEAEFHFQEALSSSSQIGHFFHICEARMHLALLHVTAGEWRRALEHGLLAQSGFQELGVHENQIHLNVSLGWAYLGLGDVEHLDETLQRIRELLKEGSGPLEGEGRAQRLFGRIARARGDSESALDALEKGAAAFSQAGNPIERARVLLDLADLLIDCREGLRARAALEEAKETFTRMGARLDLAHLERVEARIAA
jgi:class 3 adenylate cyclase/tetratricopeptide (TPR) repeat protein